MSIHPSLSSTDKTKKQRSVLKRIERLKYMSDKETWKPGDKVYGLPKIKTIKIKMKKEKAEKAETAATAAAPGAAAPEAATAKTPGGKGQDKK